MFENVETFGVALPSMSPSIYCVPTSKILELSAERAVAMLAALLKAEAAYAKLNPAAVTISERLTVADGGIDAEVNAPADGLIPDDCLFAPGLTGFQLKSGTSFKPWTESSIRGELLDSAGNLFAEVARLVEKRGRYVVLCTGHDLTPQQRNESRNRIVNVLESVGISEYSTLIDVLGASQITSFAERYPGIASLLNIDSFQEGLSLAEWAGDSHLANLFQPAPEQLTLIDQIRSSIVSDAKHIRLLGDAGSGKTRLVLEALKPPHLESAVIYFQHGSKFGDTTLFRQLLRINWTKPLIVVLDDLAEADMADIWRQLKTRVGAVKLLTLDHGHDEGYDDEILRLTASRLPDETIKTILTSSVGELSGLDRWIPICEGSPRVAHAVAENLLANPDDLLRAPTAVHLWDRFLHGYNERDDLGSRQIDCVAHHLALFSRFGFEEPVSDEATYIAQLIQKVDPTIGWARFQEIVQSLRARRVLQGSRTLFFVPRALDIYLWKKFWKLYGRSFDFPATFATMPQSLHAWFLNKFRFASDENSALVIEEILSPQGIFTSQSMLTSSTGSRFLSTLAEANSKAVVQLLENTIGKWSKTEIQNFKENRQNIVWALEKTAVWPQLTVRSLNILARLAINENSDYSNNSTGTFLGLFRIGPETAATEASPEKRLPTLIGLLRSEDERARLLGLRAFNSALNVHGRGYRIVGPEYQGLKARAKLWAPTTYIEWQQAYFLYFKTLVAESKTLPAKLRPHVCVALLEAVEHQILTPPCTEIALEVLEELASDHAMDSKKINKFFWRWLDSHREEQHQKIVLELKRLARRHAQCNLSSRFQRYVLDVDWMEWDSELRNRRDRPRSHAKALVSALAKRMASNPHCFEEISHLFDNIGYSPAIFYFGERLAANDKTQTILPLLTEISLLNASPICLYGYLNNVKEQSAERFEFWVESMLRSADTANLGVEAALRINYSDNLLSKCLDLLEKQWVEPSVFRFGSVFDSIPIQLKDRLLALLEARRTPESLKLSIDLLNSTTTNQPLPCKIDTAFSIILQTIPILEFSAQSFAYEWKSVCSKFVNLNPQLGIPLLEAILEAMGKEYSLSYEPSIEELGKELIRIDRELAWQVISEQFEASLPSWRSDLYGWLKGGVYSSDEVRSGPIVELPESSVLCWINTDPLERAPLIAHAAVPTLDIEKGGKLTRYLLIEYGEIEGVRNGISASFNSGSWVGPTSLYLKKKRDILRKWLTLNSEFQLVDWIETEIDSINKSIQREEINEERSRFE